MQSVAAIELETSAFPPAKAGACALKSAEPDYVPLINTAMDNQKLGVRQIAIKTGISKTRLGRILHRDPDQRAPMTLPEFQTILRALNMDLMHAIISVEMARDLELMGDERFTTLVTMLSTLFQGLPHRIIEALRELDGMDGTEIRKEWGGYFQAAVIRKMVGEISNVLRRRADDEDGNFFNL